MVRNVHERLIPTPLPPAAVGHRLIDNLAGREDALWPRERWPPMRLDRALGPGAAGGHGPIRYSVEDHEPGRSVRFRFTAPRGFVGTHGFDVEAVAPGTIRVRHTLEMRLRGGARLSWPLLFRPLHDALIEDALDRAEAVCRSTQPAHVGWSWRVKLLRRLARRL